MLNVVKNILTLLFLMTFADSRHFTLDFLLSIDSRLFTLDFLLSTFYSRLFTLDFLLSTLDFYSRLSTYTLDSRPSTFGYTRKYSSCACAKVLSYIYWNVHISSTDTALEHIYICFDVCDVTLSVYPHRTSLKNMPGHGGCLVFLGCRCF